MIGYTCQSGEGNGTPLQYSCLENPMDGGDWQAAVRGVAESWTQLSDFTFPFHFPALAGGFFTTESPEKLTNAEVKQRITFHHQWEGERPCLSFLKKKQKAILA